MKHIGYLKGKPIFSKTLETPMGFLEVHLFLDKEMIGHIIASPGRKWKFVDAEDYRCSEEIEHFVRVSNILNPTIYTIVVSELHQDKLQGYGLGAALYSVMVNFMWDLNKELPFILVNDACGDGSTTPEANHVYDKLLNVYSGIKTEDAFSGDIEYEGSGVGFVILIDRPISLPSPSHIYIHRSKRN